MTTAAAAFVDTDRPRLVRLYEADGHVHGTVVPPHHSIPDVAYGVEASLAAWELLEALIGDALNGDD